MTAGGQGDGRRAQRGAMDGTERPAAGEVTVWLRGAMEGDAEAMDQVNDRYGTASVTFGSILDQDGRSRVIAPAWRPEGIRNVDVE